MKVQFRVSGGIAGLRRGVDLDSSELPKNLEKLLPKIKECSGTSPAARDAQVYTIQAGDHKAIFDDTTLPDELVPLTDWLSEHSKPMKG